MAFNTDYNNALVEAVRNSFVTNVNAKEFAIAICHLNMNFLSSRVAERIKQKYFYSSDEKIPYDLNNELLDELKKYKDWFDAIIEVLNKQECPQPHVVSEMIQLKADLDKKWSNTSLKEKHNIVQKIGPSTSVNGKKKNVCNEKNRKSSQLKTPNNRKCSCGNCKFTKKSKLCCFDIIQDVSKRHPMESNKMCMSKWTVIKEKVNNKTFLDAHQSKFLNTPPKSKRSYFKLACGVYIREIYGYLGKGQGRVIPTCILNKIGKKFPCLKKKSYKAKTRRS